MRSPGKCGTCFWGPTEKSLTIHRSVRKDIGDAEGQSTYEPRIEMRMEGHGSFTGEVRTGGRGRVTVEFVKVAANGYSTYYPAGFVLTGDEGASGAVDIMNGKVA